MRRHAIGRCCEIVTRVELRFLFVCVLALVLHPRVSVAGWALNGDATQVGNQVTLTPPLNDQAGSAWIETRIDLDQDFDISFQISLGNNDAGADGISFALQNDPTGTAAFGDTAGGGEWIGMNAICPAVSVEVDTYQNGTRGDPAADHVGVNVYTPGGGGTCNGVPDHSGGGPIQAGSGADIEDATEHELRVTWDASMTTMTVYFDGTQRLSYADDMVTNTFAGNNMVYFGFTASTGGAFNEQYIIPNSAAMDGVKSAAPSVFLSTDVSRQTTYTIDITNNGIVTAFGTVVIDTLPTGFTYVLGTTSGATTADPVVDTSDPDHHVLTWNLTATPIPPNGGTLVISFDADIADTVGVGSHRNDFEVSGDNFTAIARSQTAAISIGPADLSIDKSHSGDYSVGNNETFDIDVANAGPDQATTIVVTDSLPAGLSYVSSTGTGWTADASGAPIIVWTHPGPVASGASLPPITATVLVGAAGIPSVTNTASVSSDSPDLVPGNDSDSDVIVVVSADLSIAKAHGADFVIGVDDTFTLDVANAGPYPTTDIVVTDTLPTGLTYVSSTGTGWAVDASGTPTITWSHPGPLASGASLPTITVTVTPLASGMPSVDNTASVSHDLGDPDSANDSDVDTIDIVTPTADLAIQKNHTGSFTVAVNGDYEIVVSNNGPTLATAIVVTDVLPGGLTYASSSGTGWVVDAGSPPTVTWTHPGPVASGASLPSIVLTVLPGAAAAPGVTNTASVTALTTDPNAANDSDADPTTVLGAASGNKPLYVRGDTSRLLSRDPTAGTTNPVTLSGASGSQQWFLTPAVAADMTLAAGDISVSLLIRRSPQGSSRRADIRLEYDPPGVTGPFTIDTDSQTFTIGSGAGNTTAIPFTLTLAADTVIPASSDIILTVTNNTGVANQRFAVVPEYNGAYSTIDLNALTVLGVDNVTIYDGAYPGGSPVAIFGSGDLIWIRAEVSDPFGVADIARAEVDIVDANTFTVVSAASATAVADLDVDTRLYEYPYTLPSTPLGVWTARARGYEGTEGWITDVDSTTFTVAGPIFSVAKVSTVLSDPVNGTSFPKRIPGAVVQYSVGITNSGPGAADSDSFFMTDPIPSNTILYVDDVGGPGSGPVQLSDGPVPCGLSYTFTSLASTTDDVDFSNNNGSTYSYIPSPDADGYDSNVSDLQMNPKGVFLRSAGGSPSCTITFRVRID